MTRSFARALLGKTCYNKKQLINGAVLCDGSPLSIFPPNIPCLFVCAVSPLSKAQAIAKRCDGSSAPIFVMETLLQLAPFHFTLTAALRVLATAALAVSPLAGCSTAWADGKAQIEVGFINDFYNPKDPNPDNRDRNLYVRTIEFAAVMRKDRSVLDLLDADFIDCMNAGVEKLGDNSGRLSSLT